MSRNSARTCLFGQASAQPSTSDIAVVVDRPLVNPCCSIIVSSFISDSSRFTINVSSVLAGTDKKLLGRQLLVRRGSLPSPFGIRTIFAHFQHRGNSALLKQSLQSLINLSLTNGQDFLRIVAVKPSDPAALLGPIRQTAFRTSTSLIASYVSVSVGGSTQVSAFGLMGTNVSRKASIVSSIHVVSVPSTVTVYGGSVRLVPDLAHLNGLPHTSELALPLKSRQHFILDKRIVLTCLFLA